MIHTLAMLMKFFKHILSLTITLKCFQDILSSSGVDKLLHLMIMLLNSLIKKDIHSIIGLSGILFNMLQLIWWFWAELKNRWRACYKSSSKGSVFCQFRLVFVISPSFGIFCDIDTFQMFVLKDVWFVCKFLNYLIKWLFITNMLSVYFFNRFNKINDEIVFFFTILNNHVSFVRNKLFNNQNIYC